MSYEEGHLSAPTQAPLSLVGRALPGDERAFLALVERHHASLLRLAGAFIDDPQAAEALVRRTWSRMLHRLERFDQASSLKGWLCATLIELIRIDLGPDAEPLILPPDAASEPAVESERFRPEGHRWHGHWQTPPVAWPNMEPGSVAPETLRPTLDTTIASLPRNQRAVLLLRDIEGLTSHEVQRVLDLTPDAQLVLLHRARSRMRAALERHYANQVGAP